MRVDPPRTQAERDLERVQAKVTEGEQANIVRRRLIVSLYRTGMTQGEIAARLTRASRRAGGNGVSLDAVEHIIRRWKRRGG